MVASHGLSYAQARFESATETLEEQLQRVLSSLKCPLCLKTSGWNAWTSFVAHVCKHMEAIAIASLPRDQGDTDRDFDSDSNAVWSKLHSCGSADRAADPAKLENNPPALSLDGNYAISPPAASTLPTPHIYEPTDRDSKDVHSPHLFSQKTEQVAPGSIIVPLSDTEEEQLDPEARIVKAGTTRLDAITSVNGETEGRADGARRIPAEDFLELVARTRGRGSMSVAEALKLGKVRLTDC